MSVRNSWTNQAFTSNQQASERLVSNAFPVCTELTHQPLKFWIDGNCLEETGPDLNVVLWDISQCCWSMMRAIEIWALNLGYLGGNYRSRVTKVGSVALGSAPVPPCTICEFDLSFLPPYEKSVTSLPILFFFLSFIKFIFMSSFFFLNKCSPSDSSSFDVILCSLCFLFLFVHQPHLHLHHKNKKILLPQPPWTSPGSNQTPKLLQSD